MQELLIYLLKVSVSMALLVCFYQLILRPLTFYKANRFFLLAAGLSSLLFPLVNLSTFFNNETSEGPAIISWVPSADAVTSKLIPPTSVPLEAAGGWTFSQWLVLAWLVGGLFLLVRMLVAMASLAGLSRKSSVVVVNGITACSVDEPIVPFSFGKNIYLPAAAQNEHELSQILSHEMIHVRQHHTIDIIFSELICLLQWFNPFAWVLRNAIRQNLEFIADSHVISTGVGRQEYQLLLLNVMGRRSYGMTSQFNLSSLKNRIMMMNKNSNSRKQLFRFAIIIPLAAVLLISFRKHGKPSVSRLVYRAVVMDIDRREPVEGVTLKDNVSGQEAITDKQGVLEITIPGQGKRNLKLVYRKNGYTNLESTITLSSSTDEDLSLTELVGMRQGSATAECDGCFTSVFVGDNDVIENPGKALDEHLANNGKPQPGMKTYHPGSGSTVITTDNGKAGNGNNGSVAAGEGKATATKRQSAAGSVSGDSMTTTNHGGTTIQGNVRFKFGDGKDFRGLIIVNGKEINWSEFIRLTDSTKASYLPVDAIAEVKVLGAKEGAQLYGEKGAEGVIIINAKKED